jgi:hypothetical protein
VIEPGNLRRRGLKPIVQKGRRALGRLPHLPPHLCLDPPEPGDQPAPAQSRARPSLGRVHALPLHAPAFGRRGTGARLVIGRARSLRRD